MDPAPEILHGKRYLLNDACEASILYSRYLLLFLYGGMLFVGIPEIIFNFFRVEFFFGLSEEGFLDVIMKWMRNLDAAMTVNLFWFIPSGSYYVFVHPKKDGESRFEKPRSLAHISSGILKEKMAGSLVGISSVYLLQIFLGLANHSQKIDSQLLNQLLALHGMLLAGVVIFNYTNKADHHPHNEEKKHAEDH
jgi:uncharacterized protein (TIGR00645 family)